MENRWHLKSGENGTSPLVRQYGDRLVCELYKIVELSDNTVRWPLANSREQHRR